MDEGQPVALELLQDEPLAAEQARAQPLLEGDTDRDATRRAEERVLLTEDPAAHRAQVEGNDPARVGRGEGDLATARSAIGEHGEEERLAGEHALSRLEQLAEHA